MHAILNVAIPVFAIIAAGYLCGRFRILGKDSTTALNGFVYYVALPALFFVSMARTPLQYSFDLPFIATVLGGQLATFGLALMVATFLFPGRLGQLSQHGMSAVFSNTGYMGIPLLLTAFGPDGSLPAIIATVINGALVMPFGMALLELDRSEAISPTALARDVAVGVLKSPLVIAAILGLGVSAAGGWLPEPVETFCDLLGAAAAPSALFAIGLFLVGSRVRGNMVEVSWVTMLKLIVHPAITLGLAVLVFDLSPLLTASAVILAALPTGGLVFILSQQFNVYVERAAAAILLTTVLSLVTVSAVLTYYVPG